MIDTKTDFPTSTPEELGGQFDFTLEIPELLGGGHIIEEDYEPTDDTKRFIEAALQGDAQPFLELERHNRAENEDTDIEPTPLETFIDENDFLYEATEEEISEVIFSHREASRILAPLITNLRSDLELDRELTPEQTRFLVSAENIERRAENIEYLLGKKYIILAREQRQEDRNALEERLAGLAHLAATGSLDRSVARSVGRPHDFSQPYQNSWLGLVADELRRGRTVDSDAFGGVAALDVMQLAETGRARRAELNNFASRSLGGTATREATKSRTGQGVVAKAKHQTGGGRTSETLTRPKPGNF